MKEMNTETKYDLEERLLKFVWYPPQQAASQPPTTTILQAVAHEDQPLVGTELVGTSMSANGNRIPEYERAAAQNDFVRWYDSNRGYVSCDLTPQVWTTHFRATPFVDKPGAPILTPASSVIEEGHAGAKQT